MSSEVIHLDCLNPRKLKKDKMDSNLTLINFKSYFAKRDPFTDEYKEVESSVLVFLNEMIGKGGVAEVCKFKLNKYVLVSNKINFLGPETGFGSCLISHLILLEFFG